MMAYSMTALLLLNPLLAEVDEILVLEAKLMEEGIKIKIDLECAIPRCSFHRFTSLYLSLEGADSTTGITGRLQNRSHISPSCFFSRIYFWKNSALS